MKMFAYGSQLKYGLNLETVTSYEASDSGVRLHMNDGGQLALYGTDVHRFYAAVGVETPSLPSGLKPFTISRPTQHPYPVECAVFLNAPAHDCFASVVVQMIDDDKPTGECVRRLNTIRASEIMRDLLARTLGAIGTGSTLAIEINGVLQLANSEELPDEV